jgi:hypothetical protein
MNERERVSHRPIGCLYGRQGPGVVAECPKEGGVYTIRDLHVVEGRLGLLLDEVRNPLGKWSNGEIRELSFQAHRFRAAK